MRLSHPGWMFEFLLNCRVRKVERIIRLLGKLLDKTWDGLEPLLEMAEARDLVEQRGIHARLRDQREFDAAAGQPARGARRAANSRELDAGEIRELEPALKPIPSSAACCSTASTRCSIRCAVPALMPNACSATASLSTPARTEVRARGRRGGVRLDNGESLDARARGHRRRRIRAKSSKAPMPSAASSIPSAVTTCSSTIGSIC